MRQGEGTLPREEVPADGSCCRWGPENRACLQAARRLRPRRRPRDLHPHPEEGKGSRVWAGMEAPARTFWGGRAGQGGTHRDEGLTDAGEQVRPQRVHEDLVLCEHSQQQRDGQLGA